MIFVLLACSITGIGIYWLLVRPFVTALETRIPTGSQYRTSVAPKRSQSRAARH